MLNSIDNCYLKAESKKNYMTKNALVWIREDFRIENNPALSYATQNHENVLALYIYNKNEFDHIREAQKWWLSKSLEAFETELSKFKVGSIDKKSKYGRRFDNQKSLGEIKIPKLSDLLELTSNYVSDDLIINLEIKSTPVEDNLTPPPNLMARLIIDEVNKTELKDKIIYSSFDWRILREIKNLDSKISRAYLTSELKGKIYDKSPWLDFMPLYDSDSRELPRLIRTLGGEAWHPKRKDIDKDMVRISHEEGLPVNVWTVNEKYEMLRMIEYGVDGIITDYPLRLKKLCEENGINWF